MGTLNVSNINGGQLGGFRNLIINGNFQVNQRGAATRTTTSSAYNYDRWYYDGTYLYQGVEDKSVANGTYTLSWVDAGSDITAAYVVSTDSTAGDGPNSGLTGWNTVLNGGNITVNEGTEYSKHLWVRFGGTLSNLSKVQLEHGTQATPFEHRPYGVELALCQRYYEKWDGRLMDSQGYELGGGYTRFVHNIFAVPKRAAPTITEATIDAEGNLGTYTKSSIAEGVRYSANSTAGGNVYRMYTSSSYHTFDAEL